MNKIILVADDNYINHVMVTISSLTTNSKNKEKLELFVINGGLSAGSQKKLKSIGCKIINIDLDKYKHFKKIGHLGYTTYYRLEIPKLFPNEKVVYLDCDTVVKGDINELFNIPLSKKTIGAVKDYNLNLVNHTNYFNAGLLIIDCKKWNKKNYSKKFFDWYANNSDRVRFADQCILNGILEKDWKELPLEWNRQRILLEYNRRLFGLTSEKYNQLKFHPKMIHYTGKMKPWHARYIFEDKKEYEFYSNKLGIINKKALSPSDLIYIITRKIIHFFKLRHFLEKYNLVFFAKAQ
jgi:lipopolysaccharide biosynthesis glycosyltransferase